MSRYPRNGWDLDVMIDWTVPDDARVRIIDLEQEGEEEIEEQDLDETRPGLVDAEAVQPLPDLPDLNQEPHTDDSVPPEPPMDPPHQVPIEVEEDEDEYWSWSEEEQEESGSKKDAEEKSRWQNKNFAGQQNKQGDMKEDLISTDFEFDVREDDEEERKQVVSTSNVDDYEEEDSYGSFSSDLEEESEESSHKKTSDRNGGPSAPDDAPKEVQKSHEAREESDVIPWQGLLKEIQSFEEQARQETERELQRVQAKRMEMLQAQLKKVQELQEENARLKEMLEMDVVQQLKRQNQKLTEEIQTRNHRIRALEQLNEALQSDVKTAKEQLKQERKEKEMAVQSFREALGETQQELQLQRQAKNKAIAEAEHSALLLRQMNGEDLGFLEEKELLELSQKLIVALQKIQLTVSQKFTESRERLICPLCFDLEKSVLLVPCGHCFCSACCSNKLNEKCPVCRKDVQSFQKVFL